MNDFPITRGFEFRTNDGGNIDYTNAISPNVVFDIRVSLNRFVQERRPAELFDPATLGFAAASLQAMRGYQYLPRIMIRNLDSTRPIRSTLGSTRSDWNVTWFGQSELKGVKWAKKADASQPGGVDCVVVKDPESSTWARFYEIGSNRPIFAGRDGKVKYDVAQIEHERRTNYEWYVDSAAKLLKKDYPTWKKRHVVTTRVH